MSSNLDLTSRLQAIVEGGEPDKSGRGYVLNLLAESCIEIKRLRQSETAEATETCRALSIATAEISRLRGTIKHMCDNLCSPGDCQHPDCPRAAAAPESRDG